MGVSVNQLWLSFFLVLRVYGRKGPQEAVLGGGGPGDKDIRLHPLSEGLTLACSLTGHKNHNWPIKSSFFLGKDYFCMSPYQFYRALQRAKFLFFTLFGWTASDYDQADSKEEVSEKK